MAYEEIECLNSVEGSGKGEKMCKMTQEVGSQKLWPEYRHWWPQIKD
jgi:hypothetical protein